MCFCRSMTVGSSVLSAKIRPPMFRTSMPTMLENLESRTLFALTITPREQELLEMVNRMRTAPQAELNILLQTKNTDVQAAMEFFGTDLTVLAQQFSKLTPAQPLAWDASLR